MFLAGAIGLSGSQASAHPLGNFTTNTAIDLIIHRTSVDVHYVVDLAEIPTLKIRQELGAVTGPVDETVLNPWKDHQCASLRSGLEIRRNEMPLSITLESTRAVLAEGAAGLSVLRLECRYSRRSLEANGREATYRVVDSNFPERIGWREISAHSDSEVIAGDVAQVSPTRLLTVYPRNATGAPLHQRDVSFSTRDSGRRGNVVSPSLALSEKNRGNDGLTARFEALVARRTITFPFAALAFLLAIVLGGFHALAPGHGKTTMAAYAVSRRGSGADILSIGATVALTHTVGVLLLGALVSATSVVSPDRSLRWASVVSGVLVVAVGIALVRGRYRRVFADRFSTVSRFRYKAKGHDHVGRHDHDRHDHDHHHDHDHSHDHGHPHKHDHDHRHDHADARAQDQARDRVQGTAVDQGIEFEATRFGTSDSKEMLSNTSAHPHHRDPRFLVTSHAHGGRSHTHVLPAPGSEVKRRELIAMGLAGGLVPSPSALVVLLAAIALGRLAFGIGLVIAYGVGLALTLIAAGMLVVRFERRIRKWTENRSALVTSRYGLALEVLPLMSGMVIIGAGVLLVARSMSKL